MKKLEPIVTLKYKKKTMKQIFTLMLLVLSTAVTTYSQDSNKVRYQGEVLTGATFGIGEIPVRRSHFHLLNGIRINEYVSLGFGFGLDAYKSADLDKTNENRILVMPLYFNLKGYLPVSKTTSLFLSTDIGGAIKITKSVYEKHEYKQSGFLIAPSIGASFKTSPSNAFFVSFGYSYQGWVINNRSIENDFAYSTTYNTDGLKLNLGFQF